MATVTREQIVCLVVGDFGVEGALREFGVWLESIEIVQITFALAHGMAVQIDVSENVDRPGHYIVHVDEIDFSGIHFRVCCGEGTPAQQRVSDEWIARLQERISSWERAALIGC